ncbi:hypothetical protein QQZ08_009020 [Neonectria magnoliae]|uniref:Uncharacterized protein n=1 Tax=Neonectria magnoliae TaxID=2732573 RepID=A0ABR1HS91_9HYPO
MGAEHLDTPRKARIKGAIEFMEAHDIPFAKKDVYKFNGVSERTGRRVQKSKTDRTRHNDPMKPEIRGRKRKATDEAMDKIEDLFRAEGFEAKVLQAGDLPAAAGTDDMHASIVRRGLKKRKINRRLAHMVEAIPPEKATRRKQWYERTLAARPLPENWEVVYFSDEVHFGYDDEA